MNYPNLIWDQRRARVQSNSFCQIDGKEFGGLVMRRVIAKALVAGLLVSVVGASVPEKAEAAAKPGLTGVFYLNKKPKIVIGPGQRRILHTKHVDKKTKVTVSQTKKSRQTAVVKWKKKWKSFEVKGKKMGTTTVTIRFKKKKKTTKSKLTIQVWECRLPGRTPTPSPSETPSVSPDHSAAPSALPTQTPGASAEPTVTPTTGPTESPEPTATPEYDGTPVKDIYKDSFLVGAAINGNSQATMALNHAGMADILKTHFNSTTLSNLMKPLFLLDEEATKASPDGMPVCKFDTCDPALKFCQENGIKMRGHTLVWHNQTPEWFFFEDYDTTKGLVDAATMEQRMDSYFRQVFTHCQENYPGVIYCWDVVNECVCVDRNSFVVTEGGWKLRSQTKSDNDFSHDGFVPNFWYATMGETYVEKAFACARKYADKDVKLFYNDYNVFQAEKRDNIYAMADELKQKGLIDGIGLQPTVLLNYPELDSDGEESFRTCLEKFAELGLELQITELSFKIDGTPTELKQRRQADRYREFMNLLLKEDSENGGPCNITSVTVFGICDDYPLYDETFKQNLYLWDRNCRPKACFFAFIEPGQKKRKS